MSQLEFVLVDSKVTQCDLASFVPSHSY